MITIAHRGGAGLWPENTQEAFEGAVHLGVDAVEIDVRFTPRGLIVSHEPHRDQSGPRLDATLDHVIGRVPVILDIKAPEVVDPLIQLLRARPGWQDQVTCTGFMPRPLHRVHNALPRVDVGLLCFNVDTVDPTTTVGIRAIIGRHEWLTRDRIAAWHARDKVVYAWTANEPEEIQAMVACGVDGMISDYPDRVLAAMKGAGA